jgi:ABC-type lipoprotein release transport system permease subunit
MAIPLKYNLRNLLVRKTTTLVTAGGISLVVMVTLLLMSLVTGLRQMLIAAGSPDRLIVLRKGASSDAMSFVLRDAVQALRYLPGIAQTPEGEPLVSPEVISQPLLPTKKGGQEIVLVRGVTPVGFRVHDNLRFVAGRAPQPALNEAVVGVAAAERYQGIGLGETIRFFDRAWTVVGIFTAAGSAFESEVWVDVGDLFKDPERRGCSSVRLTVAPGADREALIRRIDEDPRISLAAQPEISYYEEQAEGAKLLYLLTSLLAVIMGTGAIFGAMNTMFAAVTQRTAEIGTLRALGFGRGTILLSFVSESVCLAMLGYGGGVVLGTGAIALVNGFMRGVALQLPSFSTAVVTLRVSPVLLLLTLGLAVLMGIGGGVLPARHAARLRVTEALRRA